MAFVCRSLSIDTSQPPWSAAMAVVTALHQAGHAAVCVGGCVRDYVLGRPITDVDVASDASPETVLELFPRAIDVGAQFGVVVVPQQGHNVEVASFRSDHAYIDGRRPSGIDLADEVTDTARRDFTINALVYDPLRHEVRDHVGGLADLDARLLRVVGEPQARLREDRLRVLRALRFAAQCELTIEAASATALRAIKPEGLSRERIWEEWDKALVGTRRSAWWRMVVDYDLADAFCPLLANTSASDATLGVAAQLDALPSDAALGQAAVLAPCDLNALEAWLQREPISRQRRHTLATLVRWHQPAAVADLAAAERNRLLVSADAPDLQRLWQATQPGPTTQALLSEMQTLATRPQQALLSGADLKRLGVSPGPQMGQLLRELVDAQLAGAIEDRDAAEAWLGQRLS